MKVNFHKIGKFIADIFIPNRCPVCSRLVAWDRLLCNECEDKLNVISDSLCCVCAKDPCIDHSSLSFENCVCLFSYTGDCVKAIYSLKYDNGIGFAEYSAELLKTELEKRGLTNKIDLVTSVPMEKRKKRKRGYNQSEKIAKYLSRAIGKPLVKDLIVHIDTLAEQHKLTMQQRLINAKNSFIPDSRHIDITQKTVLLCDDVYTTGATMNACADCLKRLGAKSVLAAAIATTTLDRTTTEKER